MHTDFADSNVNMKNVIKRVNQLNYRGTGTLTILVILISFNFSSSMID